MKYEELLRNEAILQQLEELEELILEHEENMKYAKENLIGNLLRNFNIENVEELVQSEELEDLVANYVEEK